LIEDELMNFKSILKLLKELDSSDIETSDLLDLCDENDLYDYVRSKGYAYVKIDNMQQQSDLEEFVSSKIWPYYNDQEKFLL
jgi:endonuclease III-like uncharacterized protein